MEKYMSSIDVAERIGVSRATLINWEKKGIGIPCTRVLRNRRYKESDVEAFMEENKCKEQGN